MLLRSLVNRSRGWVTPHSLVRCGHPTYTSVTEAAAAAATAAEASTGDSSSSGSSSGGRSARACCQKLVAAGAAALAAVAAAAAQPALADAPQSSSSSPLPQAAASPQDRGDGVVADTGMKLLPLAMRQRIFFKYEKRIRDLSTLEKIYEYFATHEHNGVKVMTSQDVVRALVPTYPPVGSKVERAGFLDGERAHCQDTSIAAQQQLLHFFDHDRSGTLDFNEFVLIVICLSVPDKDIEVVFDVMDLDNNGVIDEGEFKQVLEQLERRAGIQQSFHNRAGRHPIVDAGGMDVSQKLFKEQGSGVHLSKFRAFLQRLQEGMLQLEFAHYDMKGKGTISGADFANSLVTAADVKQVDKYLDKVAELPPHLCNAQISYRDFKAMATLRKSIYVLSFALDFCSEIQRPLPREEFAKLMYKSIGLKLPDTVLDILMHMFGDGQGSVDGPGLVAVMKHRNKVPGYKRGSAGMAETESRATPVMNWFSCIRGCTFSSEGGGSTA